MFYYFHKPTSIMAITIHMMNRILEEKTKEKSYSEFKEN
jgi:hypothetical protein